MRRRTALAALGATLAGSAGYLSTRSEDRSSPSFDATTVQREVSLAARDEVPLDSVRIDAEVLNSTVSGEDPARIRVTLTNETDSERRITSPEGRCALFSRYDGKSDPPGLHIHQPDFPGYTRGCADPDRRGNRWRLDRASSEPCPVLAYGCEPVAYQAGETKSATYQVWDDHTVDGYMPPDTFRFEERVTVEGGEESRAFRWGFSVTVVRTD